MAKTNQIKKIVNGEIADGDDVNQIVENAGAEGGSVPYNEVSHERDTTGQESLGSVTYPWGTLNINEDAYLNEVETTSPSVSASVQIKNLRRFLFLKDCPSSFADQATKFLAVNDGEDAVEFVTTPVQGILVFHHQAVTTVDPSTANNTYGELVAATLTGDPADVKYRYHVMDTYGAGDDAYVTALTGKFKKIAGINTITVYSQIWVNTSGVIANVKVDIGGQNGNVDGTSGQSTPEWKSFTIDVSGLTNGTVYDVTVSFMCQDGAGEDKYVYLGSVFMFGS